MVGCVAPVLSDWSGRIRQLDQTKMKNSTVDYQNPDRVVTDDDQMKNAPLVTTTAESMGRAGLGVTISSSSDALHVLKHNIFG